MGSLNTFNSIKNISNLIDENNINVFVETGCYRGNTLSFALQLGFKKLYSCDIDLESADYCRNEFSQDARLRIDHKPSNTFLSDLMPELENEESVLFFLDAHLPDMETTTDVSLPLEEELDIIWAARSNKKDIIVIDDLRIYEENDYTGGNWSDRDKYGSPTLDFLSKYGYNVEKFLLEEGYIYLTKN